MGIQVNGLRFLLLARAAGIDLSSIAMIGRQTLQMSFGQFRRVLVSEGRIKIDPQTLTSIFEARYAEPLLTFLGAEETHSFDYSDYERASHVHDFNSPIDTAFHRRYTVVLDGGSLEHVFNFPVAIRNCMQMLRNGGHYLGITPTNNYMGHGFYQFSPELYFRIFSPENGFRVKQVLLHEGPQTRKWVSVADPNLVRNRVRLMNSHRTLLLVLAEKVAERDVFAVPPVQSDYVRTWNVRKSRAQPSLTSDSRVRQWLPQWVVRAGRTGWIWYVRNIASPRRNRSRRRAFFKPFDPVRVLSNAADSASTEPVAIHRKILHPEEH